MLEKIINFFKRIFGKSDIPKIEAPKESINNQENKNVFQDNLKSSVNDKMRLLNIQKEIKEGNISEKDLDSEDINKLKKLYCQQILELANSIEYYTKAIKE